MRFSVTSPNGVWTVRGLWCLRGPNAGRKVRVAGASGPLLSICQSHEGWHFSKFVLKMNAFCVAPMRDAVVGRSLV